VFHPRVDVGIHWPEHVQCVLTTLSGRDTVGLILLVLLLALLLGGLGFAVHWLWIMAVVVFIFWLVGFGLGRGESAGTRGWYRW
jgi:Kef-type K+ transport system membrane component KefB